MKDNFQIILLVVFIAALIVGVLLFSGVIGPDIGSGGESKISGRAVLWGTLPQKDVNEVLSDLYRSKDYSVTYVQKPEATYRESLIEAFSTGGGPDLFLVTDQDVVSYESRLIPFSYEQFNQRDFKNLFITEGEVFGTPTGYSAIPILIDPLVLYWNRGIFDASGIVDVPKTWDEVWSLIPTLTRKTDSGTISQSAIALSFMDNVIHKKEIFSALMFQGGSSISKRDQGMIKPDFLDENPETRELVAVSVNKKMVDLVDPLSTNYTWTRALGNDKSRFVTSQLAMYLGNASELFEIQETNPNLNFDVALIPQPDNRTRVTYGKVYGVAVSKFTKQSPVAYQVVFDLISPDFQTALSSMLSLPPVRRDLLAERPENPYAGVFFDSALASRGWLDPNSKKTTQIFKDMFDAIFSNSLDPDRAVSRAASEFTFANSL